MNFHRSSVNSLNSIFDPSCLRFEGEYNSKQVLCQFHVIFKAGELGMKGKEKTLILPLLTVLPLLMAEFFHEISTGETNQCVNWENGFENVKNFRKATPKRIRKAVADCILRGDCWIEEENWLEVGITDKARKYKLVPNMGDASITSEISHDGTKSVKIVSYEIPPGYKELIVAIAHYVRRQSSVKEGVYEIGAWFNVPENKEPLVIVGMEYHPSWLIQYFAYAAIDARDGSVLVPNPKGWTKVGQVEFEHNKWFKLWVTFDIRGSKERFSIGYKSSSEAKTFEGDVWVGYFNPAYKGYKALNFYAGLVNLYSRGGQQVYLDNFYVRKVAALKAGSSKVEGKGRTILRAESSE